jgi:hypothetical protein
LRWYVKEQFPQPQFEILLLILIGVQYLAVTSKFISPVSGIYIITQFLVIPSMVIFNGLTFIVDPHITIFESSLIGSWKAMALGRTSSLLISFIPFILLEGIFSYFFLSIIAFIIISLALIMEGSILLLASLLPNSMASLVVILSAAFLLPISSFVLLQSYSFLSIGIGPGLSSALYILSPILTFELYSTHIVELDPGYGSIIILLFSALAIILYIFLFTKSEYKP